MGIAAVTILILSLMILALTAGASILGVWIFKIRGELSRSEASFRQVSQEYAKEL